jgi:site-specific DNA recombinase
MAEPGQNKSPARARVRCAVYTRKSSEEGLEQEFNSLDAQREACEAYITSQRHEGWTTLATLYDDGAYSGWIGRRCNGCWTTFAPARSTWSSSTRSIG